MKIEKFKTGSYLKGEQVNITITDSFVFSVGQTLEAYAEFSAKVRKLITGIDSDIGISKSLGGDLAKAMAGKGGTIGQDIIIKLKEKYKELPEHSDEAKKIKNLAIRYHDFNAALVTAHSSTTSSYESRESMSGNTAQRALKYLVEKNPVLIADLNNPAPLLEGIKETLGDKINEIPNAAKAFDEVIKLEASGVSIEGKGISKGEPTPALRTC